MISRPHLSSPISDYAQTHYPIVFAHGSFGFNNISNIDYFYQILPDLTRHGANTWMTTVSPLNSSEVRGEQLLQQVEEILALTQKDKVNLIGHSHGGHSIRYVAGVIPEHVASLTTIASANKGAKSSDLFIESVQGTRLEKPIKTLFDRLISPLIIYSQGLKPIDLPSDITGYFNSQSTSGAQNFNQKFPLGVPKTECGEGQYFSHKIYYYSFMGNRAFNTALDPSDYIFEAMSRLIIKNQGDNDGMAIRCHARFGKVIKDNYNWNHVDEVNQLLGIRGALSADPVAVYRQHANRLKQQGL